ncbi:hypothetical protein ACFX12_012942 [Malus domestica]
MTKKGKGIALLLVRETSIYVDLHPPQPGRPANKKQSLTFIHIREGTLSRVSLNLKSQTPSRIAFSKIEEAPLSESRELDFQQDYFLKNRRDTALQILKVKLPT